MLATLQTLASKTSKFTLKNYKFHGVEVEEEEIYEDEPKGITITAKFSVEVFEGDEPAPSKKVSKWLDMDGEYDDGITCGLFDTDSKFTEYKNAMDYEIEGNKVEFEYICASWEPDA